MSARSAGRALALALSLSVIPAAAPAAPEDVVLVVNDFRMTRAQFDQRFGASIDAKEGHGMSGAHARKFWLNYLLKGRLLALYAERHILRDDPVWAAAQGNLERAVLAESWLAGRLAGLASGEDREEEALRLAEGLEKTVAVRRDAALLAAGGPSPPDDRIAAEVGTTKIPFLRVRAAAAGNYAAFATWPAGQTEATLRDALERLIRVELFALQSAGEGAAPASPAPVADRLEAWKVGVAQGKADHEAGLPDDALTARLEALERDRPVLLPVFVTVYRGKSREDLEAISGGPSKKSGSATVPKGAVDTLKFGGAREYWLPRGSIPPAAEKAALDLDGSGIPGYSAIAEGDGAFYVVYVQRRGDPPPVDLSRDREKIVREFRKEKYGRVIGEMVEKARGENRVEIHEDRL